MVYFDLVTAENVNSTRGKFTSLNSTNSNVQNITGVQTINGQAISTFVQAPSTDIKVTLDPGSEPFGPTNGKLLTPDPDSSNVFIFPFLTSNELGIGSPYVNDSDGNISLIGGNKIRVNTEGYYQFSISILALVPPPDEDYLLPAMSDAVFACQILNANGPGIFQDVPLIASFQTMNPATKLPVALQSLISGTFSCNGTAAAYITAGTELNLQMYLNGARIVLQLPSFITVKLLKKVTLT